MSTRLLLQSPLYRALSKENGTNPTAIDTDGGGEDDLGELSEGRDPLDPADDIADLDLPATLVGNGINWLINEDGEASWTVVGGASSSTVGTWTTNGDGFEVLSVSAIETAEHFGREVRTLPSTRPDLRYPFERTRKIFVPAGESFVRHLDRLENLHGPDGQRVDAEMHATARRRPRRGRDFERRCDLGGR